MLLKNGKNYYGPEGQLETTGKRGNYRYKAFGLNIASDILLPELVTASDSPDSPEVSIRLGRVPAGLTDPAEENEIYQVAKNQYLFQVQGVGRYYVTNGNCILVEPAEQAEERFVRLYILGSAFCTLLMQRGILPIHGSAVVINGCSVIITGVCGAGKSTLLAAFRERGYSFLTDDVAAVTMDADGVPWVHAAYPQQKLWRDSAETMGVDTASLKSVYVGAHADKFYVPAHKGFWHSPVPLVALYELSVERRQGVILNHLSGLDKLAVLMNHIHRTWLVDGLGLRVANFKQCAAVAKKIAVSRLIRPDGVFSQEEQTCLIQQDLAHLLAERAI